jgi:zinc/manganese transport system substrate-binding protein
MTLPKSVLRGLAFLFIFASLLAGMSFWGFQATAQQRIRVVATFSVIGDLVQNVGGDRIQLVTLVGPNGDTERYEPTPADARALAEAELILENGLGSEPWLDRFYTASRSSAPRVRVSQGVEVLRDGNEYDPHFWHDVASTARVVQTIRDALAGIDPANAPTYTANADAYVARLQGLDSWVFEQVSAVPASRRKLVTSHDTFQYFAERYGFEVLGVGLQSFFTDAQPSAQQINRLAQDIRRTGVPAVFIENVTDPRLMQQVANEAGVVAPQLYTDALGDANSPAATYVDMIQYNVRTIVASLNR